MLEHRVAAHARHHHVEDDEVGVVLVDQALALLAVAGLEHAIALPLEHDAQPVAQFGVVIDDENGFAVRHEGILCHCLGVRAEKNHSS